MSEPTEQAKNPQPMGLDEQIDSLLQQYIAKHYEGALVADYLVVLAAIPADDPQASLAIYITKTDDQPLYRTMGLVQMATQHYQIANHRAAE